VTYVPLSNRFIERLIGSTWRELLDHALFWNVRDLVRKHYEFRGYRKLYHVHAALGGKTPAAASGKAALRRAGPRQFRR